MILEELRKKTKPYHQNANIDRIKVKQVVENLLSNALKYSSPPSTVTIKVETTDSELKVEVEDQGQGIPLNEQDKIFLPFSKLSPKPTGNETSHGIGLSICQRIIQCLGGEIGFKSQPQNGSNFYFSIPLKGSV